MKNATLLQSMKKIIRKIAKTYHKQNYNEQITENEEFSLFYEGISTNSNVIKPFFSMKEGADVTVDQTNDLHIFSYLVSSASNHIDSLDYIYAYDVYMYMTFK